MRYGDEMPRPINRRKLTRWERVLCALFGIYTTRED